MINLNKGVFLKEIKEKHGERVKIKILEKEDDIKKLMLNEDLDYLAYSFCEHDRIDMDKEFIDSVTSYHFSRNYDLIAELEFEQETNKPSDNLFVDMMLYGIYKNDELIGDILLYTEDEDEDIAIHIGLLIKQSESGKGYGTEATKLLLEIVKEYIDIENVYYECSKENIGSIRIAEKLKFLRRENKENDDLHYYIKNKT